MSQPLSPKVKEKVASMYGGEDIDRVLEMLALYGTERYEREPERVQLAILKLADGNLGRLSHMIENAKADFRDVLYWAEYSKKNPFKNVDYGASKK